MAGTKASPKTLVEAVQLVFEALEPFDEAARQRILSSAVSLLGTSLSGHIATSAAPPPSRSAHVQAAAVTERPLSPLELIEQKNPATNAQRLAVFAYYREKVEGLARFSKDDLRQYFAKAKQSPPQNFDRDYRQAVKLGWIYDDGADSYLTSKGLERVEAGFGGKALPRGPSTAKGTPRNRSRPKRRAKR